MTVDEWMTVGEGTATWVREMILQCETVDLVHQSSLQWKMVVRTATGRK